MNKEIEKSVYEKTNAIVAQNDYELADVEFKSGQDCELTLYIYNDKGISLDDCEKVHYLVEPIIDQMDINGEKGYNLSISSLGLLRPLKTTRDYERRLNQEIEIKLYAPDENGAKHYEGILQNVDEKFIYLQNENQNIKIEREKIANAVLKVEL